MKQNNNHFAYTTREREVRLPLKKSILAMSGFLLSTLAATGVLAQENAKAVQLEEIVVTGTLIRGTEVTGSQTIGIDTKQIVEIGAITTNEILASVPQITNFFNGRPEENPRGANAISISRPNLRNMPGFNSASGSVTLVLMDGHRIAPVGVFESAIDADIFLGNTLQTIDIVTDGGSSLYGADAVAGVINFVTHKSFDGVKLDVDYGVGDDFDTQSVNLIGGTSWDDGSIYAAVSQSKRDGLVNGDRDWAKIGNYDDVTGEFTPHEDTTCLNPVRTEYGWFWTNSAGGLWTNSPQAPNTGAKSVGDPGCDQFAAGTLLPEQERDGLFVGYNQELNDGVDLGIKSYYSSRTNTYSAYPQGSVAPAPVNVLVNPASLTQATIDQFGLAQPVRGQRYAYPNGAGFSYGAHPDYQHRDQEIEISTWGIAPELTIDMSNDWQLRNTLYYGRSYNNSVAPAVNDTKMATYVRGGQLNPLNVASASSDVINDILNWETESETIHELFLARAVADGSIMKMPAGDLRLAGGFEVNQDRVRTRSGTNVISGLSDTDYRTASRDNTAFFTELAVPVLDTLDLSFSVRHDDYSDFGDTTNPQVGFNFRPTEWIKIYGHWGESFNAPTALDSLATSTGRFSRAANASQVNNPNVDVFGEYDGQGLTQVILDGSAADLRPQTAESWAIGFDMEPIDSLNFSSNYYNIDFVDILGQLAVPDATVRRNNPAKFIWNVTPQEWARILEQIENPEVFDGVIDPANPNAALAYIFDRVTTNFSEAQMNGIDFAVSYTHDTNIGTMTYGFSGNYQLEFDLEQAGNTIDQLEFNPDLNAQGIVGWSRDNVRAKVTVKYTDSFKADAANMQSSVDSFMVTDLFVGYDFQGGNDITEGLTLRFNIDNVFDEDPPEYRRDYSNVAWNAFTFGRVFKVGVTKSFF